MPPSFNGKHGIALQDFTIRMNWFYLLLDVRGQGRQFVDARECLAAMNFYDLVLISPRVVQ